METLQIVAVADVLVGQQETKSAREGGATAATGRIIETGEECEERDGSGSRRHRVQERCLKFALLNVATGKITSAFEVRPLPYAASDLQVGRHLRVPMDRVEIRYGTILFSSARDAILDGDLSEAGGSAHAPIVIDENTLGDSFFDDF